MKPFPRPLRLVVLAVILGPAARPFTPEARAAAQDPSVEGQWSAVLNFSSPAIHAHVMTGGNVHYWPSGGNPTIRRWNYVTGGIDTRALAGVPSVFCSSHAFLSNGHLLVAGGAVVGGDQGDGHAVAKTYNSGTNTWTTLPAMNAGRWYATNTTLPDGDMLVLSGNNENKVNNNIPQVWQVGSGSWRTLTGAQLTISNYPWASVAPDGRVFVAGPSTSTRYLDTAGAGSWSSSITRSGGSRGAGSFVQYEPGKVLVVGGGDPPKATAQVFDMTTNMWTSVASMSIARRQINATVLADGTVLVTGGTNGSGDDATRAVLYGEIWNPWGDFWTPTAGYVKYRGYHSTALLLPDGRVLSAGGNGMNNAEVYSPPYLFRGPRPTITSAPTSVNYADIFFVATPDELNIWYATWIRLGSVTHGVNMNQRLEYLYFTPAGGGLDVYAPWNPSTSPPGHYMLFLIDTNGVPCVARIIRIS